MIRYALLVVATIFANSAFCSELDDFWIDIENQSSLPDYETLRKVSFRATFDTNIETRAVGDQELRSWDNTYTSNITTDELNRIVGGTRANIRHFKFQVSIGERGYGHFCGGSIITRKWVLSAAHCFYGSTTPISKYYVRAGSAYHARGGILGFPSRIVIAKKYKPKKYDYDISMLKLTYGISNSYFAAFPIARIKIKKKMPKTNSKVIVSGWGAVVSGGSALPSHLRKVTIRTISQKTCNTATANAGKITKRMFCAGKLAGGKDSCQGDSGGPITYRKHLIGIVSWGKGCAVKNAPGVYTRATAFTKYIKAVIKKF